MSNDSTIHLSPTMLSTSFETTVELEFEVSDGFPIPLQVLRKLLEAALDSHKTEHLFVATELQEEVNYYAWLLPPFLQP